MEYNTNIPADASVLEIPTPGDSDVSKGEDNDPILKDIKMLLGEEASVESSQEDESLKSPGGEPRDPEALRQKLQSERDSYRDRFNNLEKELKEYKPVAEFMSSLYEDEEAKIAFISEIAPDLVKPKDPLTFIQEGLKKEFGDDFTPKNDEANVLGSRTWLYNEMAHDLLTQWREKKKGVPTNLKALADKRKVARDAAVKAVKDQKDEVLNKFKVDENTYNEFVQWGTKIRQAHLYPIWAKARGIKPGVNPPVTATVPGGRSFMSSSVKKQLDDIFGPN